MTENQKKYHDAVDKIADIFRNEVNPLVKEMNQNDDESDGQNAFVLLATCQDEGTNVKCTTAVAGRCGKIVNMLKNVRSEDEQLDRAIKASNHSPLEDLFRMMESVFGDEKETKEEKKSDTEPIIDPITGKL